MFKLVIIFLFILTWATSGFSCDTWFESLKIKDSKSCISICAISRTDMSTYFCPNQCDNLCKNFGKTKDDNSDFYDLTEEEVKFCRKNSVVCVSAYKLSWFAEQSCLSIYSKSKTNDESDACRHYMWAYYLTQEFGENKARTILSAHESNPKQDPKQKAMDLFNNEVSIKDYKISQSGKVTPEKALLNFKLNLKNKKFIIIKPNYSKNGGLP